MFGGNWEESFNALHENREHAKMCVRVEELTQPSEDAIAWLVQQQERMEDTCCLRKIGGNYGHQCKDRKSSLKPYEVNKEAKSPWCPSSL